MNRLFKKSRRFTLPALALGLLMGGQTVLAQGQGRGGPSPGPGAGGYGPGMIGPGMMRNATPEQRQQHWEQVRQQGYGPGMMRTATPEQRQQHWEQMRQQGYGPA